MLKKFINSFVKSEKGATAIEYTLIAALIAVVCIAAFTKVGCSMKEKLELVSTTMEDAGNGTTTP